MKNIMDAIIKTYRYEMTVYGDSMIPTYLLIICILIISVITL